jgi:hypothetical protein
LSAAAAAHMIGGRRLSDDGTGWFQLPLPVASRAPAGLYRWCSLPCCLPPASSASRYSVCRGSEMDGGQEPEEMRNLPVLVLLGFTLGFIRLRCAARCLAQVRLRDYVYISVPPYKSESCNAGAWWDTHVRVASTVVCVSHPSLLFCMWNSG